MRKQFVFVVAIGLAVVGFVAADDNVREVQTKLSDEGFYFGEIDGAYSSDLSAALSRYQIRNGLPISGQLDVETSKALGAKPAVGPSTAGTEQSSETWRRLRKRERRTSTKAQRLETAATEARETSSPTDNETPPTSTEAPLRTTPVAKVRTSAETREPASAPPATERTSAEATGFASAPPVTVRTSSESTGPASAPAVRLATGSADEFSAERLRDYVAAYVLAGLDKNVGAETEFFADRVHYYDQGVMDRDTIRQDLKRYDERWPERHFWVAGKINVEPQSENRVRVTFPLGFRLRNANKQSSGKVDKTLVLERAGDDLQIVAVNEHRAE
ncbi:MAG TPA: peptidoglycan-binding protein [Candidatus Udaeobacter sp.]|nr:peptidoglycan-binding protein [Candidatus Udaeobacter sp.]